MAENAGIVKGILIIHTNTKWMLPPSRWWTSGKISGAEDTQPAGVCKVFDLTKTPGEDVSSNNKSLSVSLPCKLLIEPLVHQQLQTKASPESISSGWEAQASFKNVSILRISSNVKKLTDFYIQKLFAGWFLCWNFTLLGSSYSISWWKSQLILKSCFVKSAWFSYVCSIKPILILQCNSQSFHVPPCKLLKYPMGYTYPWLGIDAIKYTLYL